MTIQDTRFMRFMIHFWIRYHRFKGASRVCAILLNFLILLFKTVFCGVILLIAAPHIAAGALLNRPSLSVFQRVLYALFVVISLVLDIPLLLVSLVGVLTTAELLMGVQLIPALICGTVSWTLIRTERLLLCSLFCRDKSSQIDEVEDDEEESTEEEEEQEVVDHDTEDDIDDLVFCQLFTVGEEMCLLIDHIEMCPDETAFIRVVDDEGYTPLYKRKVRRDKAGNRFIVFNSTNYYLDDNKTHPIIKK